MSRTVIVALAYIIGGIFLIVRSRWITQNYVDGYDKLLKWLFGPLSPTHRSHLWMVAGGAIFIVTGLAVLLGFLKT